MTLDEYDEAMIFLDYKMHRKAAIAAGLDWEEVEDICEDRWGVWFEDRAKLALKDWVKVPDHWSRRDALEKKPK